VKPVRLLRFSASALLFVALLASPGLARGQATPSLDARLEPPEIAVGQEARLVVTITGVQSAPVPQIPAVDGLGIRHLGQTMSMQFVNGAMSSEVIHNFSVRPERTGQLTIPAVRMHVAGQSLSSAPIHLSVYQPGRVPPAPRATAPRGKSGPEPAPAAPAAPDEAQVALLEISGLPARELFIGEVVPIELRLFVREGTQVTQASPPELVGDGFTLSRPANQEPKQTIVRRGGVRYTEVSFPAALSPITTGDIPLLASIEITARVPKRLPRQRGRFGDPFFDSFFDSFSYHAVEEKIPIRSDRKSLHVAALPENGRPASFSGGIGRFTISASAEPHDVFVGDPVTFTAAISGEGNFDRLEWVPLDGSASWKTYDASARFEKKDDLGIRGVKTFEQAVMPLRADLEGIPARELSYFDPKARRYVTLRTEPIGLQISATPGGLRHAGVPAGAASAGSGVDVDGYEIAPNKIDLGRIRSGFGPVALQPWFLALQALPLFGLAATLWWTRRRRLLAGDEAHVRDRAAQRELRVQLGRMDEAIRARDVGAFFDAARRAIQERVAAQSGGVASSLTRPEIEQRLTDRPEAQAAVRAIFEAADAIAYGGQADAAGQLGEWKRKVESVLAEIASRRQR